MPRILRILNRFNLGGPTYNAAYLTRYLSPEYDTLLIGGRHRNDEDSSEFILNDMGINAVVIPDMQREINPVNDLSVYNKIKQLIKDFKPDIVHTHAAKAGMLGRRAAFSLDIPVIVHTFHGHVFHSYFNPVKTATFIQIERALAKRTSRIIAISELQKKELTDTYKIATADKMSVIPLGFDLDRFGVDSAEKRKLFRERYDIPENVVVIGIVGRIVPIKNHRFFVEIISKLKKQTSSKVIAVIVGDGELRNETEEYSKKLGLKTGSRYNQKEKTDIIFTSWIRDIDRVYSGLDIVALTSKNEGTPVSLIEALASGKPVVSTNVGGILDVVEPGKSGLLSEENNTDKYVSNLLYLVNNPKISDSYGKYGKNMMSKQFGYKRLVSETAVLYEDLLKNAWKRKKKPILFFL